MEVKITVRKVKPINNTTELFDIIKETEEGVTLKNTKRSSHNSICFTRFELEEIRHKINEVLEVK